MPDERQETNGFEEAQADNANTQAGEGQSAVPGAPEPAATQASPIPPAPAGPDPDAKQDPDPATQEVRDFAEGIIRFRGVAYLDLGRTADGLRTLAVRADEANNLPANVYLIGAGD